MKTIPLTPQPASASYGIEATLELPFDEAIDHVKEALKSEGFGVLTTIDVQQTLHDKLGVEFERYVILGACNPTLAYRALQAEHNVGLLLPCNVIVHEHGNQSAVSIIDPLQMLGFVGDNPDLLAVAKEADVKLRRVVSALENPPLPREVIV